MAQPIPSPQYTAYWLLVFSVRSYVRRELAGLSCYDAVEIVYDDGRTLMRGSRRGLNGTGNTWTWPDIRPGNAAAPA